MKNFIRWLEVFVKAIAYGVGTLALVAGVLFAYVAFGEWVTETFDTSILTVVMLFMPLVLLFAGAYSYAVVSDENRKRKRLYRH